MPVWQSEDVREADEAVLWALQPPILAREPVFNADRSD